MLLDLNACVYDASIKIHISMILDPDACIYDAVLFGNEPTNKAILGVGCYVLATIRVKILESWGKNCRIPQNL